MFSEPTLLILGAGASSDFDYPIGSELVHKIIQNIDNDQVSDRFNGDFLLKEHNEFLDLRNKLEFFNPLSIDEFLEHNRKSKNHNIVDVGKQMIAYTIMKCENRKAFIGKSQNNWYKFVQNAITSGTSIESLINEDFNLKIITFNYDISLEYYLFSRFEKHPIFSNDNVLGKKFLEKISNNIIHVYGSLKSTDEINRLESNGFYSYGFYNSGHLKEPNQKLLDLAYKIKDNIKLIGEEQNSPEIIKARNWIKDIKRIYFLGYGFNDTNNQLLDFDKINHNQKEYRVINYQNSKKTERMLQKRFGLTPNNLDKDFLISKEGVYKALEKDFSLTD